MDWRLVGTMGALGLVPGVLRLYGWIPGGREFPVWVLMAAVWITLALRRARQAPFQHVFMASVLAGLLSMVPAVFWLETYAGNNPLPDTDATPAVGRGGLLAAGAAWGVMFGALAGALAAVAVRFSEKGEARVRGPVPLGAPTDITHPERDAMAEASPIVMVHDDSEE